MRQKRRTHDALAVFFSGVGDQIKVAAHRKISACHTCKKLLVVPEAQHHFIRPVAGEHDNLALLVRLARQQVKQKEREVTVGLLGMAHHRLRNFRNVGGCYVQRTQVDVEFRRHALGVGKFRKAFVFNPQANRI